MTPFWALLVGILIGVVISAIASLALVLGTAYVCEVDRIYCEESITSDPVESQIVIEMTTMYLSGRSLKAIADSLNARKIPYSPGVVGWNKSRIMRLMFDERYTGSDAYPTLIDRSTHEQLLSVRNANSRLTGTDLTAELYRLTVPVICPVCGSHMKRRVFDSKRNRICWICKSCQRKIFIDDNDFMSAITGLLNTLIADPSLIAGCGKSTIRSDPTVASLEREITAMLERPDLDKDAAMTKLRELASLRYRAIDPHYYISRQLNAEFEKADPLEDFSADFTGRTIKEIRLDDNANITIILMNGQSFTEGA